jgi:hypothetical protein
MHADAREPLHQRLAHAFMTLGVAVRDHREGAAGEVARIRPAAELQRLGRGRILAARGGRIRIAAVGAH